MAKSHTCGGLLPDFVDFKIVSLLKIKGFVRLVLKTWNSSIHIIPGQDLESKIIIGGIVQDAELYLPFK